MGGAEGKAGCCLNRCHLGPGLWLAGLAPPLPVAVRRGLGLHCPLCLRGGHVVQEAVVQAVPRNKLLDGLDLRGGLCRRDRICARGARTQAGLACD